MYRGFKLPDLKFDNPNDLDQLYSNGLELYRSDKVKIKKGLDKYVSPDGVLDGTLMQKDWFPDVKADVFISHSHGDEKLAVALAAWLRENFQITAFIDSCIWEFADNLLLLIDKKHCWQEKTKNYNYNLRNYSTSHVHMMLATALSKMIDKTECLFFLKTKKSTIEDGIKTKTLSPWIYSEIEISKIIQKKWPERYERATKMFAVGGKMRNLNEAIYITHDLDLSHLAEIDAKSLNKWAEKKIFYPNLALDKLYDLIPIPEKSKIL